MDLQTTTRTDTKLAVGIMVGMTAAFFLGVSMIMIMSKNLRVSSIKPELDEPVGAQSLQMRDINSVLISTDSTQVGPGPDTLTFGQFDSQGNAVTVLGTYDNTFTSERGYRFIDGVVSPISVSLMVKVTPADHKPLLISVYGNNVPPTTSLIPTAHAQVIINEPHVVCLNNTQTTNTSAKAETGLFGIPTAHAQVTINPGNTNTNPDPSDYAMYYVDINGNIYLDSGLTSKVNPIACNTIATKAYSPWDFTNVTSTTLTNITATFLTSMDSIFGSYNLINEGEFNDIDDLQWTSQLPLGVIATPISGTNGISPQSTLTITNSYTDVKNICLPAQNMEGGSYNLYFYDTSGNPYSDVFLQNRVSCGTTSGSCSTVSCTKYPTHPCCAVDNQQTPQ